MKVKFVVDSFSMGAKVRAIFCLLALFVASPIYSQITIQDIGGLPKSGSRSTPFSIAYSVSDDGTVIVGETFEVSGSDYPISQAFRWTSANGSVSLGTLAGDASSTAKAVSGNGLVVVGDSEGDSYGENTHGFRWTSQTGMVSLGTVSSSESIYVTDTNYDGSVVVGMVEFSSNTGQSSNQLFRWTSSTGLVKLGNLPSASGVDYVTVSSNGNVIAGYSFAYDSNTGAPHSRAFRWTSATGLVSLGMLAGDTDSAAIAQSDDGSVIVGWSGKLNPETGTPLSGHAFKWTSAGMVNLGAPPGNTNANVSASAVSGNGSVVSIVSGVMGVGGHDGYDNDDTDVGLAYRWTQASGIQSLGSLSGYPHCSITNMSKDGLVITGECWGLDPSTQARVTRAFRWTSAGMVSLGTQYSHTEFDVFDINANGSVIVGKSSAEAAPSEWSASRAFRWTQATGLTNLGGLTSGDNVYGTFTGRLSNDNSVIVGQSGDFYANDNDPNAFLMHAYRWSSAGIINLGTLPGDNTSAALGTNSNGSIVIGDSSGPNGTHAFRWTSAGMVNLGTLPGDSNSYVGGMNLDGSIICGSSTNATTSHAFRWTSAGMTQINALPGDTDCQVYMSGYMPGNSDGTILLGSSWNSTSGRHAFRWTTTGVTNLGALPGKTNTAAFSMSSNGSTIVGTCSNTDAERNPIQSLAFRWTSATGIVSLGTLPGDTDSECYEVSNDGTVVAGVSWNTQNGLLHAFRWTSATGMVKLGQFRVTGMSTDGAVISGTRLNDFGETWNHSIACIWTAKTGLVDLADYLRTLGVDMTGWQLNIAFISPDATTVWGISTRPEREAVYIVKGITFTTSSALPTITTVSPTFGPTSGGTRITITGTNLSGATSVKVNGVAATDVVVASATSITASTPSGMAGAKSVAVTTSGGTATKAGAFTYVALAVPTITSVSPASGPSSGGTAFTIIGTNLTGATSVQVNGVAATNVVVVNATTITARTPAGTAGAKSVAVTTAGGVATKASAFTYVVLAPTITSIAPTSGSTLGGTVFTITGTNLTGGASVQVNGVAATNVVVVNATTITARTPAGLAGAKNVSVTTAGGTATKASAFTFVTPPTITTVSPTTGSTNGATTIAITGTNLVGVTSVTVNGVAATNVIVVNASAITAKTPAGTVGAKNVSVTTPGGTATKTNAFTYVAPLVIASILPTSGPTSGGTILTITGTNLTGARLTIQGTSIPIFNNTGTSFNITTPAHLAGVISVTIATAGGTINKPNAFKFVPLPTITSISPPSGPTSGDTEITITGANFTGATSVQVNGVAATSMVVVSATSITARTPAGTVGAKSVTVTTIGGTATNASGFTYTASFAGGNNNGGGVVAGKMKKPNDTSDGQLAPSAAEETVVAAPMGVQLYLQTIITQPDADVDCANTQSSDANAPDTTAGTTATIDLDHNGEADICQLRGGDLDLNGVIDDSDMSILLEMIGVEPLHGIGDMDANGVIDSIDMGLLLLKVK